MNIKAVKFSDLEGRLDATYYLNKDKVKPGKVFIDTANNPADLQLSSLAVYYAKNGYSKKQVVGSHRFDSEHYFIVIPRDIYYTPGQRRAILRAARKILGIHNLKVLDNTCTDGCVTWGTVKLL